MTGRRLLAFAIVLGEREAVVQQVRPVSIHGAQFVDVTVGYPDGARETARLGTESVPQNLEAGERVLVSTAVKMIVAIRRP